MGWPFRCLKNQTWLKKVESIQIRRSLHSVGLWKPVWKLKCPNKIKHFLWRACKNIIPTNFCLASRKVTSDSSCGFCGDYELSGHALWDCGVVAEVLEEVGLNSLNWINL